MLEQFAQLMLSSTPVVALFLLFYLLKTVQISPETRDHLWLQFDKIFVGVLLLFAFWLLTHNLKFYKDNDSVINQTWGVVTFFLGLLSGLITGGGKQRVSDRPNSNGGGDAAH